MNNILKYIVLTFSLIAFSFAETKAVYSGEDAITLSPQKSSKRVDIIIKTYSTEDDNVIKKRSHKRRRKVRRPRQGR